MDKSERDTYRRLANDSIIATFGSDGTTQRLAEALEKSIEELDDIATDCDHCKTCEYHGDYEDESFDVDVNEILRIQKQLKALTEGLKRNQTNPEGFAEILAVLDSNVDELEAELMP